MISVLVAELYSKRRFKAVVVASVFHLLHRLQEAFFEYVVKGSLDIDI